MTEVPVGAVGKPSKPAQLQCSAQPTPHEPSTDTNYRLLARIAFEFHGLEPLIALALLALRSHPPHLPGRN